ncbi:sulfotransferase family cytosolic 1B member 1-like [Patiria miniata]|uniref:Sulfotransferase domain-containing protein n=1 Tax=Patiria miniata TaxID=46514 RepID=A0A914B1G3_PATMI|nr:sulfotransferase family cytosolic 1B member 1-like [Patiria miniata]
MAGPLKMENWEKLLYVHRGVTFHSSFIPPDCWDEIETFQARPSDICVAAAMRSGTHWMLRIINLILGTDSQSLTSPIFEAVLISAVTNPDAPRRMGYQVVAELPTDRPRVLYTHLPATHVPKSFWNTDGVKIIYVIRNPIDVIKSGFKLDSNIFSDFPPFSTYLKMTFDPKQAHMGTWINHARSFWERRNHKNVLFVYYEDLKESFQPTVASIANFLERPLSQGQLDWVQERSTLEVMRAIQAQCPPNKGTGLETIIDRGLSNEAIKECSDEDVALVKSQLQKLADTDIRYLKEIQ